MTSLPTLPLGTVLSRALAERCPNCGESDLFKSYLKPVQACPVCDTSFAHIRADDGPAWLTILLVGHIVVPSMLYVMTHYEWAYWFSIVFWLGLTTGLVFTILPRAKALFIAIIWRTKATG